MSHQGQLTVLVTGASGLLGANLVLTLCDDGHDVTAVSKTHIVHGSGIRSEQVDLNDAAAANALVQRVKPHWIVHCAALTDLDFCQSNSNEALRTNAEMARTLATAARNIGTRLIYISTDSVFDGAIGDYREDAVPAPLNHYADSKWQGEKMVMEVSPDNIVARVNIYGWNAQPKQNLAEWIFGQLEKNASIPGFADVVFNPLFVNDLSAILIRMMQADLRGLYHLGSRNFCSKYEFARMLAGICGFNPNLVQKSSSDQVSFKTPRPKITTLNTEKVSDMLDFKMPDLQQGLEHFHEFKVGSGLSRLKALLKKD